MGAQQSHLPGIPEPVASHHLDFGGLENSGGFMLRIAQLTAFENLFAAEPAFGLRISEYTVLVAISRNAGLRQGELADALKIKWPNMTKLVRELETQGLIERRVPKTDRRAVQLGLTPGGARKIREMEKMLEAADRAALSMLDGREMATLLALLHKIAGWPGQRSAAHD